MTRGLGSCVGLYGLVSLKGESLRRFFEVAGTGSLWEAAILQSSARSSRGRTSGSSRPAVEVARGLSRSGRCLVVARRRSGSRRVSRSARCWFGGRRTDHQAPQPSQGRLLLPEHVAAADCHLGGNFGESHAEAVAHEEQPPLPPGKLCALDLDVEEEVAAPFALGLVPAQVDGVRSIGGPPAPSPSPVDDAHVVDRPVQPCLLVGDRGPAAPGGGERLLDEIIAIPGRDALPKEESPHSWEQAKQDLGQGGSGVVGVVGERQRFLERERRCLIVAELGYRNAYRRCESVLLPCVAPGPGGCQAGGRLRSRRHATAPHLP